MALVSLREASKISGVPYATANYHLSRLPVTKVGAYNLIEPHVLLSVMTALGWKPRMRRRVR